MAVRNAAAAAGWASSSLVVLFVAAMVVVLLAPQLAGWRYGILRSGSMSPAMPAGAAIVVAPVGAPDVRPGDVITYRSESNSDLLVTHRVVLTLADAENRPAFVTQGDANEEADPAWVTSDRLVGRVIFSLPYIGRLSQELRSTTAFVLLIALPAALIVLLELRELALGMNDLLHERRLKKSSGSRIAEEI